MSAWGSLSVCPLCGSPVGSRGVSWDELALKNAGESPSTATMETAARLQEKVGEGTAHRVCFERAKRNTVDAILDEVKS